MEETVLRPKPMPGRAGEPTAGSRPEPARRRGRRLLTALLGVLVALMLVLAGVGLGTVGATVISMSSLADLKRQAGLQLSGQLGQSGDAGQKSAPHASEQPSSQEPQGGQEGAVDAGASAKPGAAEAAAPATLGVEAIDLPAGAGAQLVGVHVPGPAYAAGLVRGDVILAVGEVRIASAAALAETVRKARPGAALAMTVRHRTGERQSLVVTPGVVT